MEEAAEISAKTREEEPTISIKTCELLSKAELLMCDIEELLDLCTSTGPSNKRQRRKIKLERQANMEEDGETLIIDDYRFESAVTREDRRRPRPLPGRGGGGRSDGLPRGLTTQGQRGQGTSKK